MPRELAPAGKRRWGQSRTQQRIKNNLGIISTEQMGKAILCRDSKLDTYDKYYENTQYDDLMKWDEACESAEYVPVRKRQPKIKYNLAKILSHKVAGKITGTDVFPKFSIEDDPEDSEFFRLIVKVAGLRRNLVEPMRHMLISGSCFVRFYLVGGQLEMEWANAKYCYPVFDAVGELEQLEIKYVYEDHNDKDAKGTPKKKWYRMILSKTADVLYDNPEYREGSQPQFVEVERNNHGLGWVQGEWFRTSKRKFSPDGDSIIGDILDFIDSLNYSLSQSDQAVAYNQDPQLAIKGLDEDALDSLIRSSQKAWNLGKEGEAAFIESQLNGIEAAQNNRDHNLNRILEVVRVVLHDPEKIVGNASSGKALELLNGPLVELIDDLRTIIEPSIKNLLIKIAMTILMVNANGEETELEIKNGYQPKSLDLVVQWPAIFPMTIEDLQKKVSIASQAAIGNIISRETLTRWLAPDFGIENVDEEVQKIGAQPVLNPFGTF